MCEVVFHPASTPLSLSLSLSDFSSQSWEDRKPDDSTPELSPLPPVEQQTTSVSGPEVLPSQQQQTPPVIAQSPGLMKEWEELVEVGADAVTGRPLLSAPSPMSAAFQRSLSKACAEARKQDQGQTLGRSRLSRGESNSVDGDEMCIDPTAACQVGCVTWRQGASKNLGLSSAAAADTAEQRGPGAGQSVAKLVVTGLPGSEKLEDLSAEDRVVIEAALEAARKSGFQGGELAAGAAGVGQGGGAREGERDSLGWTTVAVREDGVAVCIPAETWKARRMPCRRVRAEESEEGSASTMRNMTEAVRTATKVCSRYSSFDQVTGCWFVSSGEMGIKHVVVRIGENVHPEITARFQAIEHTPTLSLC